MAGYNNFIGYGYPTYTPGTYQQQNTQPQYYNQMPNYQQTPQQKVGIEWVDGEVGAKAFQLPAGWPVNVPMPLWDTNDTIIYLKSINGMGMPNPIQKVRYTMEQSAPTSQSLLPAGNDDTHRQDMSEYVRKEDFEQLKEELKSAISKEARGNGKSSV